MKIVVFKIGSQEYGVGIEEVRYIERLQNITELPKTPDYLKGIMHLRGNVVPVIDTGVRLGFDSIQDSDTARIIVVQSNENEIGLIVDAATDVIDIDEEIIQPISSIGSEHSKQKYLKGVANLEERLLVLVKLNELLTSNEVDEIQEVV